MKTLVTPRHPGGPFPNGYDGCHTRWENGFCKGVETAKWLNALGEDEEPYYSPPTRSTTTNGRVRENWLRYGSGHVVAVDYELLRINNKIAATKHELAALKKRRDELLKAGGRES